MKMLNRKKINFSFIYNFCIQHFSVKSNPVKTSISDVFCAILLKNIASSKNVQYKKYVF